MDQTMHSMAYGAPSSPTTPTPARTTTNTIFSQAVTDSPDPLSANTDSAIGRNFAIPQFNKGFNKRVALDPPRRASSVTYSPASSTSSSYLSLSDDNHTSETAF